MAQGKTAKTRDRAMDREEIVFRLRSVALRIEAEMAHDGLDGRLTLEQAALLDDICRALGLDDGDVYRVLGEASWWLLVPIPAMFMLEGCRGEG